MPINELGSSSMIPMINEIHQQNCDKGTSKQLKIHDLADERIVLKNVSCSSSTMIMLQEMTNLNSDTTVQEESSS
ncbi:unnamed protein product, partial [Ilex paraguariensis]